ncbi:MAG: redoxin domain-containing protein [Mariniblastus sp.]|nr:redoxin domain-containing protein [Mariniblastus sp.]
MKTHCLKFTVSFLTLLMASGPLLGEEIKPMPLGERLPTFELPDFRGRTWPSTEFKESKLLALVFLGTECPLVKLYANELKKIATDYPAHQLQIIGVNSNRHDSITEMGHFVRTTGIEFPVLKDVGNQFADQLGATRTPEVFLFDADRKLCYRGRINDLHSYGQTRPQAKRHDLVDGIDALLAGQPVKSPTTEVEGCIIGRIKKVAAGGKVTFANQISRILQKNCVPCHRPGEIAPFSLTDYQEVAGWAEMIGEVVRQQRMPPWHANPAHGEFKNDARLADADKQLIYQWIDDGAPLGDVAQLPPALEKTEGWQIGQPDVVIPMSKQPFQIPATGVMPYKYFVVDPGFKEDKWIQAAECRAGNRSVVHHIIVGIRGRRQSLHSGIESKWVTATAPGAPPLQLPEGHAKLIPAGSQLVFQMHYTPNGTATTDISQVGFVFADPESVENVVGTQQIHNRRFRIPPQVENHEVRASIQVDKDLVILSLFPHMHLRGKSFRYVAHWPDGREETLLDVPRYDFNWQNGYDFAQPLHVPGGTRLECIAHYDNSENNFANPDPESSVRWGDQTFEEMMIGYFDCYYPAAKSDVGSDNPRTRSFLSSLETSEEKLDPEFLELATQALSSSARMNRFGRQLKQEIPQLDRVCWTAITDGQLRVERVTQVESLERALRGEGLSRPARQCQLGEFANQTEPVKVTKLNSRSKIDMQFFGAEVRSSFHVPVQFEGKRGTINFWSREADGFPSEAQQLLVEISRAMVNP